MTSYPIHPACSAWPAMTDKDLQELAADIAAHGQLEAATLTPDGQLLDGRNRQAACAISGVELLTIVYDGDPVAYSISKNMHRRHMDKTALAFAGAVLAKLSHGTNRHVEFVNTNSRNHVAEELGIPIHSIDDAKAIMDKGSPEVIELAKTKRVGLRAAADYVRSTPKNKQLADAGLIKKRQRPPATIMNDARPAVRALLERGEPIDREALRARLGVSNQPLIVAEAYERGRLEGIAEAGGFPDVPLTERQKQTLARIANELSARFDLTVAQELQKRLKARDTDDILAVQQANAVLDLNSGRLRPPLNPQEYATVLWSLHPDNQSETKTAEAFVIMRQKKHVLCDAGRIERKSPPLPEMPVRKTAR